MAESFVIASLPLVVAPLSLAAGAVASIAVSRVRGAPKRTALRVAAISSSLFGALPVLLALPSAKTGAVVLSHVARLFRVGSLDAVIGFAMDGLGATIALVAIVLSAIASFLHAGREEGDASDVAVTLLAGAGAVTAALAEGFPTLMLGLAASFLVARSFARAHVEAPPARSAAEVGRPKKKSKKAKASATAGAAAAPAAALESSDRPAPPVEAAAPSRGSIGLGAFGAAASASIVAFGVLFWALGGRWLDDTRYLSDYRPRFRVIGAVAAPVEKPNATPNPAARTTTTDYLGMAGQKGTLTIVSHPGARVYLGVSDESQLVRSDVFGQTPFVKKELPAGLQKIVIVPGGAATVGGDGLEAALVDLVAIKQGAETVITLDGPTMTFHELAPQIADRSDVANRRLGSARAGTAIALAGALALVGLALAFRRSLAVGGGRAGAATTGAVALALLALGAFAARLGGLASLSAYGVVPGTLLLASVAALAALRDRCEVAPMAALVGAAGMSGGAGAAAVVAIGFAFALVALAFSVRAAPDAGPTPIPRWLLVSMLAGLPIPVGPFLGIAGTIGAAASGSTPFIVAAVAIAASWIALAFAVGHATREAGAGRAATLVSAVGAIASIAIGVLAKPWAGPDGRGSLAAVFVGALAALAALLAYRSAAKREAREVRPAAAPDPNPWRARAVRILEVAESIVALPTTLIDLAVGRPKREARDREEAEGT